MTYVADVVLFAALLFTALCVGSMYRELRRLRGYQAQYVRVFDETSKAVGEIEGAVRSINQDGRDVLKLLGGRIDEARELVTRLEALAAAASGGDAGSEDFGIYSRASTISAGVREQAARRFGTEIVDIGGHRQPGLGQEPARSFRLAPSVRTLKAAGGTGS